MDSIADRLADSAEILKAIGRAVDAYRDANHDALSAAQDDALERAAEKLSSAAQNASAEGVVASFAEVSAGLDRIDAATKQLHDDIRRLEATANSVARALALVKSAEGFADAFVPLDLGKAIEVVKGLQNIQQA